MNCVDVTNYAFKLFAVVLALRYLIVVCLFFFVNSLFYSLAVVGVSRIIMFYMVSSSKVSLLVFIFFIIVYVGAMMIFIGYICAVCPNFVVHSKFSFKFFVLLVFRGRFIVNINFMKIEFLSKQMVLVDYFYSS